MAKDNESLEKVRELISDSLEVDISQVDRSASFIDDLGADSLDIVELVMAIEKEFDIEIPDDDVEKMRTIGDAIEYLKERAQA